MPSTPSHDAPLDDDDDDDQVRWAANEGRAVTVRSDKQLCAKRVAVRVGFVYAHAQADHHHGPDAPASMALWPPLTHIETPLPPPPPPSGHSILDTGTTLLFFVPISLLSTNYYRSPFFDDTRDDPIR